MKWPPQGTNLDLIEMLWICVDEHIKSKTPQTRDQLFMWIKLSLVVYLKWASVNLVNFTNLRCLGIIKKKRDGDI